jgi:hypothetical protein
MTGEFEAGAALGREALDIYNRFHDVGFDPLLATGTFARETMFVKHDPQLAARQTLEAVTFARRQGNPFTLGMAHYGAAIFAGASGDLPTARVHFLESQEWMRKMGNRPRVIGIQSELAHLARHEGNLAEATRLYRETLTALQEFGHRGGVARNLECLAFVASAQQQPLRAARLIGAANALRELSRVFMMPEEVPETEQAMASMRGQVPAADFEAAWAEGRALDMDQAIAYALQDN